VPTRPTPWLPATVAVTDARRPTVVGDSMSRDVARLADRHPAVVAVARLGWVAKGLVYGLVGVLAASIAIQRDRTGSAAGGGDHEASALGAVAEIAQTSLGALALWVVAIGLALYVVWRLVSIVLPAEHTFETWLARAGYAVSAAMYSFLAWSAMSFATDERAGRGAETEDAKIERLTREVMARSAGRWVVGVLAACVLAVGLLFVVKGVRASFHDDLEPRDVGPVPLDAIVALGRIGWVGRGSVMVLYAWFLAQAVVRFRPSDARGLDDSLREVTEMAIGPFIVAGAGLALVAYGLFCVISAPRQRLTGAH
jgi:Domain of Unknown Function (DUF1206)